MGKITQEMVEASYNYGIKVLNGEISERDAVESAYRETGLNRNSMKNSITNLKCLLRGEKCVWSMSVNETLWKLERIRQDFGKDVFQKALVSVEKCLDAKGSLKTKVRDYIKSKRML